MILKYLSGRERLMVAACVVLIACQVYLDLRIPEYMSEITDHLQMGTATEIVVRDGERMLACAFASVVLAIATVVIAARMSSSFCNRLRSMMFQSVESFSRQEERLGTASSRLLDNSLAQVRIMSPMHAMASSMMNFLILAIYWIGAGLIQSASGQAEQMSLFSDMIVFTSYATQVISAVMMSAGILRGLPRVMVSSRRIEEVIAHEPSIVDGPGAEDKGVRGEVVFEDVSFAYPGSDRKTLSHVSFRVSPGETVAIIGPTASGKSTLVNLIPRLYDVTSGRVTVDGVDVRRYVLEDLYSRTGYVPQTAVVFAGTVRENVGYGRAEGEASDAEVWRALDIAQLSEHVRSMPEGIDTDLAQHGWSLSGGQRQRLAIARAVFKEPEIYIFDDTFSALDYRTDKDLRNALESETRGATKIVVAQRVGTIVDADRIIVLDGGRVVGEGTHGELMESCPLYRDIAESQTEAGS